MAQVAGAASQFVKMLVMSLCTNLTSYEDGMSCSLADTTQERCCGPSGFVSRLSRIKELRGRHLRITTLQKMPQCGTMLDEETGELRGVGVAFDLLHELQKHGEFTYNITLPEENVLGNEESGMLQLLANNEVDMAVTFIPMLQSYRRFISFSTAVSDFEWVLLMARPSASATGSGLLAPFQREVWLLILVSLIIVGPVIYLIIYLRVRLCRDQEEINKFYPLPACVWFVYGALMKQGSTLSPVSDSARLLFATWWIFITILTSFYTANLTAFLTLSQFTLTIETPKDIFQYKRQWMADQGGMTEDIINNEPTFSDLRTTISTSGRFVTEEWYTKLQRAAKGEIYISEKRSATSIMLRDYMNKTENQVAEKDRCKFVVTPKTFMTMAVAFAFPKNTTLDYVMDPMLMYLVHGGIVTHLLDNDQPLTTICPLNLANSERKLRNSDLIMTYEIVGIGFGCAAIAFIGEVFYRFYKKGMKWNEISKPISVNSGDIKQAWKNGMTGMNQKENAKNDNFIISQYYNEMITPYRNYEDNRPYQRMPVGHFKQASSILFQYTH